eukprot:TRINITY_DN9627_c0_g1_i1.p1 TRINITY_DN9627_c0_g1~~TRINITY_DN9627_c0_g1_i1.p1  ORF type:complete len:743 (-),score=141.26 TRINITY_DN9627_c0_g1_i1:298-2526(-)
MSQGSDIFTGVLSERKNSPGLNKNARGSKLNVAQKILSFDPRLTSGDRNSYGVCNQNVKTTKTAMLINNFSTTLIGSSPISDIFKVRVSSMDAKEILDDILKRVATIIIRVEIEEVYNEYKAEIEHSLAEERTITIEICDSILTRTMSRLIKRVAKSGVQTAYFSLLIYKGLVLQFTKALALSCSLNLQYNIDISNTFTNEFLTTSIKTLCTEITNDTSKKHSEEHPNFEFNGGLECSPIGQCTEVAAYNFPQEQDQAISELFYTPKAAEEIFEHVLKKCVESVIASSYLNHKATSETLFEITDSNLNKCVQIVAVSNYVEQSISLTIYNSFTKSAISDCVHEVAEALVNTSKLVADSLILHTLEFEIAKTLKNTNNFMQDVYTLANTLYGKIIMKVFTSEIASIRDSCAFHTKVLTTAYEDLFISPAIKAVIRDDLTNAKTALESTNTANQVATLVYDKIEDRLNKEFLRERLVNVRVSVLILDEILSKVCAKVLVKRPRTEEALSEFVSGKIVEKRVGVAVDAISLTGIVASSLTNSMVLIVCSKVIEKLGKDLCEDILLEREMEDIEEVPTTVQRAIMISESFSTLKCRRCKTLLSKIAMKLHNCRKMTQRFDSLEKANQELLRLSEEIEAKGLPFPDAENIYKDIKAVIVEAFKINWNVSALERLELEPEKIAKTAELRSDYAKVAKFCDSLIDLIGEKIRILELKKEEPSEDENEDKEFIAYSLSIISIESWRCCRR